MWKTPQSKAVLAVVMVQTVFGNFNLRMMLLQPLLDFLLEKHLRFRAGEGRARHKTNAFIHAKHFAVGGKVYFLAASFIMATMTCSTS